MHSRPCALAGQTGRRLTDSISLGWDRTVQFQVGSLEEVPSCSGGGCRQHPLAVGAQLLLLPAVPTVPTSLTQCGRAWVGRSPWPVSFPPLSSTLVSPAWGSPEMLGAFFPQGSPWCRGLESTRLPGHVPPPPHCLRALLPEQGLGVRHWASQVVFLGVQFLVSLPHWSCGQRSVWELALGAQGTVSAFVGQPRAEARPGRAAWALAWVGQRLKHGPGQAWSGFTLKGRHHPPRSP